MGTKCISRVKASGEVFTPRTLIREMLDKLPNDVWFDPNKTWLEPAAGDGNFLVEVKSRLMQVGHDEKHILDNMLFSIELIDDNHFVLQHRLGYLVNGYPNPKFWKDAKVRRDGRSLFSISEVHTSTRELNKYNPYHANTELRKRYKLKKNEVIHHRNHVCWSGLDYNMSFGRVDNEKVKQLPLITLRKLGTWHDTDTPDVGESYVVERNLNVKLNELRT